MRKCQYCKIDLVKKPKETWKVFNRKKYCSHSCYHLADKGSHKNVHPNSLKNLIRGFTKGMSPWNKGKKGEYKLWPNGIIFTLEHIAKIKEGLKGKTTKYWLGKKRPEMSGKNSPFWKGGLTPLYWKIRNSFEMKQWRKAIFERDNYTCIWCGNDKGGNLNADHIISFASILHNNKINTFEKALECKILWDISNGRTLCHSCHTKTENYGHLGGRKEIHYFKNVYSYEY